MFVSIIVITRNRPHIISNCLESILKQTHKSFEIIAVDSSTDEQTREIIKNHPQVKYVFLKDGKNKIPESRNLGIKKAIGDIIAFLDDDTLVDKEWLTECVDSYKIDSVGVVGGTIFEPDTKDKDHHRQAPIGKITISGGMSDNFDCDPGRAIEIDTLRGCNMSFRADLFKKLGDFDPNYTGSNCREEADVIIRFKHAGFKVIFNPKMFVEHLVAPRENVSRSMIDGKANFYLVRNTAYFFLKNFGIFNIRTLAYFFTKDTKVPYFFRTFSLNGLWLIINGIVAKLAAIGVYFRYMIGIGKNK